MPTVETVLATRSYLDHLGPGSASILGQWHNDHHAGPFQFCDVEPCASGEPWRWHYDAGHAYAPDMCDLQPCHALARLHAHHNPTGRMHSGRLNVDLTTAF